MASSAENTPILQQDRQDQWDVAALFPSWIEWEA